MFKNLLFSICLLSGYNNALATKERTKQEKSEARSLKNRCGNFFKSVWNHKIKLFLGAAIFVGRILIKKAENSDPYGYIGQAKNSANNAHKNAMKLNVLASEFSKTLNTANKDNLIKSATDFKEAYLDAKHSNNEAAQKFVTAEDWNTWSFPISWTEIVHSLALYKARPGIAKTIRKTQGVLDSNGALYKKAYSLLEPNK